MTEAVLRSAAGPVLVVPAAAAGARRHRPLVVAVVDRDGAAPAVLRAALEHAARSGGRVRLLHPSDPAAPAGPARARAFGRELLRSVAGPLGVPEPTTVATPEPPDVAVARHARGADVVVVAGPARGAAGWSAAGRRAAGERADSLRAAVLRAVPCALLVVPAPVAPGRSAALPPPPRGAGAAVAGASATGRPRPVAAARR